MSEGERAPRRPARYTWGGDEFLFVEVDEAMSLAANFAVMAIAARLSERALDGIVDICPANASLLIRFDPDALAPTRLEAVVREIERDVEGQEAGELRTRIVDVPVWYDDPFTAEVGARFRAGYHQDPDGDDLDYAASVNGLESRAEFVRRHQAQPWIVSMVGFVAGLPFLYQLVEQDSQLVVPKYLSPRTDTPRLTLGHGGCFGAIYSVRGAGGYQMFGVVAPPIYDPEQRLADFAESSVLFRPGDLVRYRSIDRDEYDDIQAEVAAGTWRWRQAPAVFSLADWQRDPVAANRSMTEALDA
ncbi:carboxyltransferase domain-containing protein [Microbacterium betulae]|uniref:Carboxyltransferase domain-containing protein n=1 Tax=Microbacterium betulae TaxID=2981139 RepID=A0AA97FK12_9MICO|nr:carboxyltransferase domain-containing protein [Microbacterium sp. AB]WOF22927.1 carboxyltransferase domain-containing protein [Microbacterium sp. AB]